MTAKIRNNPISGMNYFLKGFSLIMRKGVKRFVIVPLLINSALFAAAIYFGLDQFNLWMAEFEGWLPEWLSWLTMILKPIFIAALLVVVFFTFAIIGNLIAAPFNGLLAEAVEKNLTGQTLDMGAGLKRMITDLIRSLFSELRKLIYFILWSLPILVLFFIPVLNIAAPFIWILFSAWMLTVSYADYPMANHQLMFPEQRRILKERRMLSLGFGGTATLALMIPVVNFLVIPTAVAGATAMWVEQLSKTKTAAIQEQKE